MPGHPRKKQIDWCTKTLCEIFREFARDKTKVDLALWVDMYAFDVLGELFYGKSFGFMRERTDIGNYMKAIESLLPAFPIGGTMPSYLTKLYFIATAIISPSFRGALGAVNHLASASSDAVEQRFEDVLEKRDDRRDMLRKDDRYHFAGADTTAAAVSSILYHLMRSPTHYEKLAAEIDTAISEGRLSLPVVYSEAIKLPYLKACVNEGMRIHPSVGLTMPRVVPSGGSAISGVYIPEGYRVGVNAAVVQYDRDVFGADADHFNPDRWLEGDAVQMEKVLIPFGAGSGTCIGKNISLSEIYELIPQLLRDFQLRLVDPGKEWATHIYWFNKATDVHVYVAERDHIGDVYLRGGLPTVVPVQPRGNSGSDPPLRHNAGQQTRSNLTDTSVCGDASCVMKLISGGFIAAKDVRTGKPELELIGCWGSAYGQIYMDIRGRWSG
ncbi:uncharacterized protein N7482_009690 [Penicillium canariense]|uniref:Cytochrome P450 n=1 Tax=Penicillium canariense TaxID=189055 RepID=A0A9W9HPW7_9EURO|nr:uncharacterized protein N7482_009690 [Penicillium canariense]KAJ5153212.1 hypothetical protein N7482_009690 [Penicillium canariense]